MITKISALVALAGVFGLCISQAQSPTPAESPSPSQTPAKHRVMKKAKASPAPSTHPTPSPSPGKFNLADLFKPKTSASANPAVPASAVAHGAAAKTPTSRAPGGGHGKVWVNTETHVYHKEGSRFYGTTKKGKYMSEAEAIKEGNKAAQH
jgi:hypothetical protein